MRLVEGVSKIARIRSITYTLLVYIASIVFKAVRSSKLVSSLSSSALYTIIVDAFVGVLLLFILLVDDVILEVSSSTSEILVRRSIDIVPIGVVASLGSNTITTKTKYIVCLSMPAIPLGRAISYSFVKGEINREHEIDETKGLICIAINN